MDGDIFSKAPKVRPLVVVGNGPSLRGFDLRELAGFLTIGMNAAYRHWDRIGWYPAIYTCLDDAVVVSHRGAINRLIAERRCRLYFLHHAILDHYPDLATRSDVIFSASFLDNKTVEAPKRRFELPSFPSEFFWSDAAQRVTTGSHSVRLGLHLGCRDVLLLGIDANYIQHVAGSTVMPDGRMTIQRLDSNPNYFFDDYQREGDVYNPPNPSAADANFHLSAFQALARDLSNVDCRIRTGSRASNLYRSLLFDFIAPETFLRTSPPHEFDIAFKRPPTLGPKWIRSVAMGGVRRSGRSRWSWPDRSTQGLERGRVSVLFGSQGPIRPGSASASVFLSTSRPARARVQLAREGSSPFEGSFVDVNASDAPQLVRLALDFHHSHEMVRISVMLHDGKGADHVELSLSDPNLTYDAVQRCASA